MPIVVDRDDARRRLTATATGVLTAAEVMAFVDTQRAGDLRQYALLFDARQASTRARPADAVQLAERVALDAEATGSRGPAAIVAGDGLFELATLYETYCHGAGVHVIRVFRERDDAERWLGW